LLRKYENTTKIKNKCYFLYALKWVSAIVFNIQHALYNSISYVYMYIHTHARTSIQTSESENTMNFFRLFHIMSYQQTVFELIYHKSFP